MIKLRRLLVFTKVIVVFFEVGMGMIKVFTKSGGGLHDGFDTAAAGGAAWL
jgi:hypothetical protein